MSKKKLVLFSLIPLLLLLITSELALRVIYFQIRSETNLALISAYQKIRLNYLNFKLEQLRREMEASGASANLDELWGPSGEDLLLDFQKRYEAEFRKFLAEAQRIKTQVLVLFIPSNDYKNSISQSKSRRFFSALTTKYHVPFIDMTSTFLKHEVEDVTLLPENGHLSRFGNKLVALELRKALKKYSDYRSNFQSLSRPVVLGDLKPNDRNVSYSMDSMPFRVVTNSQGLRMVSEVRFPKEKQRVLFLGDSFTYGPYLPIFHTYPYLLSKMEPNIEFLNAGVSGYTITDELALFSERAKYSDPDITVLQVLDNDLSGFFYFIKNEFDRSRGSFKPTKIEESFFQKLTK